MSRPPPGTPVETVWQGRYIAATRQGAWEYVGRVKGTGAAVILALDGDHVILIEQWRVPLGRMSLELPAGLIGDEDAGERCAAETARRELEEETGYRAETVEVIGDFASSPGMVAETFTLVRATGLTKVGEGGGVEGEDIRVYRVPLDGVAELVAARRAAGSAIDVRILALLGAGLVGG